MIMNHLSYRWNGRSLRGSRKKTRVYVHYIREHDSQRRNSGVQMGEEAFELLLSWLWSIDVPPPG